MSDEQTLGVYDMQAADYAKRFATDRPDPRLDAFLAEMPAGAHVLELGCGPGRTAARMIAAGLTVDAVDASAGMAAQAKAQFGVTVRVASFDQIEGTKIYDGIWANFSLLHAPRAKFPGHLAALHTAAKPGARLHIGMKQGTGEGRDSLGRHYAYYRENELTDLLSQAGFSVTKSDLGDAMGMAGAREPWIIQTAYA
ncbi:bifunctional 2-polyprenyl-6-hydroxyphenol methylase/3-demethylubiquinol 3-O-methyltransferase UbiG [Actibacterium sp. 188UL27-1]|uniref:class I SAM-dependent methyltransferase n=1 Tax=Actibacterium sp. 188UL27-1 TaxID=2786961 RepID=UPI001955FEA9|nr:class I SAM-dependent methyltransferase [Actibacterium sp. 188UL27-1]MBM7067102.1 class I SAM-dependent methyltransferase [Actibacterium sp. 188UL27-1]